MVKYFLVFVLFLEMAFCQSTLNFKGNTRELLSSERSQLKGILYNPKFSPHAHKLFSFSCQLEDNRFCYIFNTSESILTIVQTVPKSDEMEIIADKYKTQSLVFNDQLDWCPVIDDYDRQWFAFVSNGSENNHDIYISYVGSNLCYRLTNNKDIDNSPKWSPDGESIAFISARNGKGDIYLIKNVTSVMENEDPAQGVILPLTQTREEETELAWNPNPESHLLAFSQRVYSPQNKAQTYQIKILNIRGELKNPFKLTNKPDMHFSRPIWDPSDDSRLVYTGQPLGKDQPADLFIDQLQWNDEDQLESKKLTGRRTELFKNVNLGAVHALWISGGKALLVQEKNEMQNNPIYILNIDRWLNRRPGSSNYFNDLHTKYPLITGCDIKDNTVLFSVQVGKYFKIFATQVSGSDIQPWTEMKKSMAKPVPSIPWYYYAGGGAGAATGLIIWLISGDDDPIIIKNKIGLPPSMPNEN